MKISKPCALLVFVRHALFNSTRSGCANLLPIPLDVFAGNDLTELEAESISAAVTKRRALDEILQKSLTITTTTTVSIPPQPDVTITAPATDPTTDSSQAPAADDIIGYSCDGCQMNPLVGARYRDQEYVFQRR